MFLRLEIIKKLVGMILLLSTMWFGVIAMAYSLLVGCVAGQIINSWPNKKLLNYGYREQLKDIIPEIILAVLMGVCVYPIAALGLPNIVILMLRIVSGVMIYITGSIVLRLDSFTYLYRMIKGRAQQ